MKNKVETNFKKNTAITLVTLIITVILMLILAFVTFNFFYGVNEIPKSSYTAKVDYKIGQIVEAVKYGKMTTQLEKEKNITSKDVMDKIKETSTINNKKYILQLPNDYQGIIIEKEDGIVVKFELEENEIKIDTTVTDNINNYLFPQVTYTLTPEKDVITDKVVIRIIATEEENNIKKLSFPNYNEITYEDTSHVEEDYEVTENGTYTFVVTGGNGNSTAITVPVTNIKGIDRILIIPETSEPINHDLNVTIKYDETPQIGDETLSGIDKYQYKIGNNEWTNAISNQDLKIDINTTIYARYFDGNVGYNVASLLIANIDKVAPTSFDFNTTKTTSSITITGSTTDIGSPGCAAKNIGIAGYQFKLMNNLGEVISDWSALQTGTSYTFDKNIVQTTEYKVSMRALDKAGNITVANSENESVQTGTVTPAEGSVTILSTPTTVTNGDITVKISTGVTNYIVQYKVGNENWNNYTQGANGFSVSKNQMVYARLVDNNGQTGSTTSILIANIDKVAPNSFNLTASKSTNSITINGSTTDTGSAGCAVGNIGIAGYQFKLMSSTGTLITDWTEIQTGTSYTFDQNITQTTEYKVSMRAIDKAGNITEATNKNLTVKTETVMGAEGNIIITPTPTTPTNENVTIKMSTSVVGYTIQYKVGNGNWNDYTYGVNGFTVDENQILSARLVDAKGQAGSTLTISIANIDKIPPVEFNLVTTKNTNSITIIGNTTDLGSVGCAAENMGIAGYQFRLMSSGGTIINDWTAIQEATSYTFDQNIIQTTEYKVSMRAIDKAGNITEASNKNLTVKTETVMGAEGNIIITPTPTTSTNENVTIKMSTSAVEYTIQYKLDGGSWINYTQGNTGFIVEENQTILARLVDSNGQAGNATSVTIANIDKVQPNAFSLNVTKTTNSITVSGSTTDTGSIGCAIENIGIVGYQYKLMNSAGTTIIDWTSTQIGTSYTFNQNITQTTEYKVSMRAIDKAGNITEATNKNLIVKTETVLSAEENIVITPIPSTVTNTDVKVVLTTTSTYSMQYNIGETQNNWNDYTFAGEGFAVSENCVIYARLIDNTGQTGSTATLNILNIDKLPPIINSFTASNVTENTFELQISADDATATSQNIKSGIKKYELYINNNLEEEKNTSSTLVKFDVINKIANTEYYCKVIVYDNAGNFAETSMLNVKTLKKVEISASEVLGGGDNVAYEANGYDKWKVFRNEDGIIELISNTGVETASVTFSPPASTPIEVLPPIANKYINFDYAESARPLATDVYSKTYQTHKLNLEDPIFEDLKYLRSSNNLVINQEYLLTDMWNGYWGNVVQEIRTNGSLGFGQCGTGYSNMKYHTNYVRVIVKLKKGVKIASGDGSPEKPYVLSVEDVDEMFNVSLAKTAQNQIDISIINNYNTSNANIDYQIYVNEKLNKTITSTYNDFKVSITSLEENKLYNIYVKALVDGSVIKETNRVATTTKKVNLANSGVKVGDYINYNAGTWTADEINNWVASGISGVAPYPSKTNLSNVFGSFGGFVEGDSRNSTIKSVNNVIQENTSDTLSGWRVWDINKTSQEVTLVSAGTPELFSLTGISKITDMANLIIILLGTDGIYSSLTNCIPTTSKNSTPRDWSMYVSNYATSAKALNMNELRIFCRKNFDYIDPYQNYFLNPYLNNSSSEELYDMVVPGMDYAVPNQYVDSNKNDNDFNIYRVCSAASPVSASSMYSTMSRTTNVGIRVLVTLKSNLSVTSGLGTKASPYNIDLIE